MGIIMVVGFRRIRRSGEVEDEAVGLWSLFVHRQSWAIRIVKKIVDIIGDLFEVTFSCAHRRE